MGVCRIRRIPNVSASRILPIRTITQKSGSIGESIESTASLELQPADLL